MPMSAPILPSRNRTGIPEVMEDILSEVAKGVPLSIADLARKIKADRRTVSKALDLIYQVQESLKGKHLERFKSGNIWVIRLRDVKERAGKMVSRAKEKVRKGNS